MLDAARNVFIRINTDAGIRGWGEASPFLPITGDSQESNLDTAIIVGRSLLGLDPLALDDRIEQLRSLTQGQPSIRSAFDIAFYDIAGRAKGLPVYALLGGKKSPLRSDFTIGMQDSVAATLARLEAGLAQGFNAVKLKVGRPGLHDVDHVKAVIDRVGQAMSVKIDANQGWDYETARDCLAAMEEMNLLYCEQPTPANDYQSLKRLREDGFVAICADESLFDEHDAQNLLSMEAVDYLNIKLGKSGGISTGLRINALAEAAGCRCMVGCFAESRLGLTAAAHLAMAQPNIAFVDLDSAFGFIEDPVHGGGTFRKDDGGVIRLTDEPGFGASLRPEFADSCHWASVQL